MQITARSEYAVRAVLDLARHHGEGYVLARQIAERQHIPPKFLPQILHRLRSADLLDASRGAKGGFRLRVSPSKLSVRAVIEAIQGPVVVYPCLTQDECALQGDCPICGLWADTRNSMLTILSNTTFSDLVSGKNGDPNDSNPRGNGNGVRTPASGSCPACGVRLSDAGASGAR